MAVLPLKVFSHLSPLTSDFYHPPVDYAISLAGNFGEPRPNHFHGGLDIRTEGVEGKHIYAIGDGYVSRITVGKDGFGNAVYITHPTGHTSVYCHLKAFSPRIKRALRRYQYRHQTNEADARLSPVEVPVSCGQFIALSGNTGSSTAPHLHLEIHDTRTWNMLDPYQFLNDFISDSVPPQVHAVMAIPQHGGSFNNSQAPQTLSPLPPAGATEGALTAWGKVGFAVWADDYMQGSYNHYGIHETLLFVDGRQVFQAVVDDIPVSLNRMVNAWGCYDQWFRTRRWFMKSYIEPGNTLPCLTADSNRGIVSFDEPRDYHLEYVLRDYKGNEVRHPFTVRAQPPASSPSPSASAPAPTASTPAPSSFAATPSQPPLLRWNRTTILSRPGVQLVVPYGLVAADVPLSPTISRQPDRWSDACQFAQSSLPLMTDARLSLYAHRTDGDPSKLYVASTDGRFMGGDYHDGWVTGRIRELGACYELRYDDLPPTVQPVSLDGDRLLLNVTDGESGIASWQGTVDGRFVVFDAIEKITLFACLLRESWLPRTGQPHRLHFEVTDNRHNTQSFDTTFTY